MSDLPQNSAGPAIPEAMGFPAREGFYAPFDDEQEGIGLKDLWLTIRKRLWLLIAIAGGMLVLVGAVTFEETPLYSATAEILLKPDIPQALDVRQWQVKNEGTEQHDFYKTQTNLAGSPAVAAQVIQSMDLERNPLFAPAKGPGTIVARARAALSRLIFVLKYPWANANRARETAHADFGVEPSTMDAYLKTLKVTQVDGTQLMDITFTTPDPVLSARIANAHARAYIARGLQLRRGASEIVQAFLRNRLSAIGARVQQSEAVLNTYRRKMGILSFQTTNKHKLAETRMIELEKALTDAETSRIDLGADMQLIAARHYNSLPQVIADRTIEALEPEVDKLGAEYSGMAAEFTDRWPALAEIKAQYEAAEAQLTEEVATVTQGIRRQYEAAVTRVDQLQALVATERQKDFAANDAALEDAILSRRVETNRELYKTVLKRIQEVGIVGQGPSSPATIATPATAPPLPSYPSVIKNLAIAGMGGILIGLASVLLLDKLDKRFKSVDEIERSLRLPKFALIPDFATAKRRLPGPATMVEAKNAPPALARRRNSARPEIIRLLHTSPYLPHYQPLHVALQFSRAGGSPKLVMFTSATPQEGKTASAAGAAFAGSQMGCRTLLIDADLHRPQCHDLVATEDPIGLSDVLAGQRRFADAVHSSANGVFVIPAGSRAPNPAALLASGAMRELLVTLGKAFDHVIIDTAPVLAASETIALATMVDGVVLVIGSDTPRKAVLEAYTALRRAGALVLGFVYNRVDLTLPQHRGYANYPSYEGYYYDAAEANGAAA
jgi:capsular exopolysaccharide synthesis family protein